MNDQMAKLKLLQQIPLHRFVKDLDWAFTDSAIGQTYHIHLVLQDDSILKLQAHSSDDLIRKANLDLEQYAEKQGWIEPTPVDVLQREEVKNYIIGTSKDFDSSAQVHFVRLTLQDGAISSGMHPNPMIAEEKATIAAIEYSIKKGWIEKKEPTWLDRVKQEQAELQIKLDALDKTLNVERKPDFITDQQWIFMTRQQFHMRQYNQILKDRIANAV